MATGNLYFELDIGVYFAQIEKKLRFLQQKMFWTSCDQVIAFIR